MWDLLTDVEGWPSWYRACRWVRVESTGSAASTESAARPASFRWKAHPIALRSTVVASDRPHCFVFIADARGLHAEHAFTLRPAPDGVGTVVLSHETQAGPLPRLGRVVSAPRLHATTQAWLTDLARAVTPSRSRGNGSPLVMRTPSESALRADRSPHELVPRDGTPDTIAGWKAVADGLLTDQCCAFHRNVEISSRYAWIYKLLPACFKWAGMAAIASHHVRLALFPLRLDTDRTGYVDIPHSLGRQKTAADGGREHDPGDEQRHLQRHLLGSPRVRHAPKTGSNACALSCERSATTRPSSPASRRSTRDAVSWRTGRRPRRLDGRPTISSGRATSSSSSTSSAPWCNPTSIASRARSPGSSRSARPRASRCVECGRRLRTSPRSTSTRSPEGSRTALRAQAWPRITRFDDRWRWLVTSVVPRFRRFDADTRLIDASLRRIVDEARDFASMPCVLPLSPADSSRSRGRGRR